MSKFIRLKWINRFPNVQYKPYAVKVLSCLIGVFFVYPQLFSQSTFSISGTLSTEYDGADIYLAANDSSFTSLTTKCVNGSFYLRGLLFKKFTRVYIAVDRNKERLGEWDLYIKGDSMQLQILRMSREGDRDAIRYANMPLTADRDEFRKKFDAIVQKRSLNYQSLQMANVDALPTRDSLQRVDKQWQDQQTQYVIEFIKSHRTSYFALHMFEQEMLNKKSISPDTLAAVFMFFDPAVRVSEFGKKIAEVVRVKQALSLGKVMPRFSFLSATGERYGFNDLREEKLVLISFWASWCGPCRRSIPKLKDISNAYKQRGLRLISVSTDDSESKWRKALSEEKMPWLQTCDLPKYTSGVSLQSLFDVAPIPQYFLLDNTGRLIYHNILSQDDDNYTVLQKILSEKLAAH